MAETEEKAPKSSAPKSSAPKGGASKGAPGGSPGKGKDKAPAAAVDHTPKAVEGTPRLQEYYEKTIRARLAKEFGLANPNQVPRVVKVVLNVGM